MLDFVADELDGAGDWRRVLEAYRGPSGPRNREDSADEGCLRRFSRIDGVDSVELSKLHGILIALGLLKVDIRGKIGMQYQITPLGRQTLEHGPVETEQESEEEPLSRGTVTA